MSEAQAAGTIAKDFEQFLESKRGSFSDRTVSPSDANASKISALIDAARLPKRQSSRYELDRSGKWAETEQKIISRLGSGFMIALAGTRGNGKTQIAVEAAKANSEKLKASRYCTATEFLMDIKSTYRQDAKETEGGIIKQYATPSLLIIDELGQRSENDWENRLLYELLNRRYNAIKDTLLISNHDAKTLMKTLGDSLCSRLNETGGIIDCTWETYRK